ncbi:MAG: amidohydrolase family protein, partial [Bacteroidota bacterium]
EPSMPNLKFEAMRGVLEGDRKLYVHADGLKEMTNVIDLCDRLEITPVIVGGRDAWRMADVLKEKSIPVILRKVQSLPGREDNDIDQPFKTARLLHEAGVDFCFSMGGAWEQRNLSFQAGQAVAYGLDKEAAIAALSGNTARIMGIDDRTGSLEVGKAATLFISAGDALDMRTCKVEQAFIDGREIDLDNKQKALSRKFRKKYADPER